MSRSRQAARLAAHLAETTGVRVELVHDTGAHWILSWTDGPLAEQMRAHLTAALAGHRYAEMRDRTIECARSHSRRAWAARAVASRREGTLAAAVADGAAGDRALGVRLPRLGRQDPDETHEHYALLRHIEELCRTTASPDRAGAPEDEEHIGQLLAAGTRTHPATGRRTVSEYDMARALLAAEQAPSGGRPPQLRPVPHQAPPKTSMEAPAAAAADADTVEGPSRIRTGMPACWSWPPVRPNEGDVARRFWDGIDTTGYNEKVLELLQEAAGALDADRAALTTWQADRCAVCGQTGHRLVLDHDHATGLVRGWLCNSCNTREGTAVGPGSVYALYRQRPPTAILGLTIRYRDPLTGRPATPAPPRTDGWDDNASAGLT
ncbi:endonuclease domain-containing protein [Streptomyces sp. NPDC045470]|uniref:endonuclease domain-containing protein n=1 Tax=Streptomyces sp. NPDC045470 TaxID=3155469 RepID=UPI0033F598AE